MVLAAAQGLCADRPYEAIVKPSKDRTLAFTRPGRVAEVKVKEGQAVPKGTLLLRLDDRAERIKLEQLKAEAEDTTRIEAAEAELKQKQVELKKIRWAAERGAATELEVERAEVEVTINKLRLKLARFQHRQNRRAYEEHKARVERMRLESPIGGIVEEILVRQGESADALEKVVRVIQTDPLWADVPVPLDRAREIRAGDPAEVHFGARSAAPVDGKVLRKKSVADAASDTLIVRVEVPNGAARPQPAGQRVWVTFPAAGSGESEPPDRAERTALDGPRLEAAAAAD